MNGLDSSPVQSSMERAKGNGNLKRRLNGGVLAEEEVEGEEVHPAMWQTLDLNFRQVQTVLDRNRVLIQQVNENHQSKIAGNMVKNVALIQEINGNISKVVSMYSDLGANFSDMFQQPINHDGVDGADCVGGGGASIRA